jgi:hypothetical protein
MSKTLRPGQLAPKSGIYDMLGPRGGHTGELQNTRPRTHHRLPI